MLVYDSMIVGNSNNTRMVDGTLITTHKLKDGPLLNTQLKTMGSWKHKIQQSSF